MDGGSPNDKMRHSAGDHPALAESYLLGELDESQRAAFEVHMLDCSSCAEDVVATSEFLDAARAVMAAAAPSAVGAPVRLPWRRRGPGALTVAAAIAAAALVAVVGYQALLVIPYQRYEIALRDQPRALAPTVLRSQTRGQPPQVLVPPGERFFAVVLDLVVPPGISALEGELRGGKDETVLPKFAIPLPPPGEPVQLLLPAAKVVPGEQILIIRRPDGEQIERFTFRVARAR